MAALQITYTTCDLIAVMANATTAQVEVLVQSADGTNGFRKTVQVNFASLTAEEQETWTAFLTLMLGKGKAAVGM